jgi:type III pantothenate kinase
MNLSFDIGNTATKWASFEGRELTGHGYGLPEELLPRAGHVMVCASGDVRETLERLEALHSSYTTLHSATPLPIRLDYKTPGTLGADRVADACGAAGLHPGEACLVIDAGTCITVDFVDAQGTYHGGAIMPGLKMNLQALHTFTAKLPLIDLEGVDKAPVLGRTTEESILAGTVGATLLALAGYVALYKEKAPALRVLLTGGDAERLAALGARGWEMVPQLTMIGLNEIMINLNN